MLQKWLIGLLVAAAQNPEVQKFFYDLALRLARQLKEELLDDLRNGVEEGLLSKLTALLPAFGSGLIKEVFNRAPNLPDIGELDDVAKGVAKSILDADPDLPIVSEFVDLSEILKKFLR